MHAKGIKKSMHRRAIFQNALKKPAQKKLISIYKAVFCFTLCLTLNGVLDLLTKEEFWWGILTWFCPEAFGFSSFSEMTCLKPWQ